MSNDNYDDILNRTWDEMPEDKLAPDGGYILKARNATFMPPKGEANAKVLFFYTISEPVNVDEDALAALGEDYDLTQNEVIKTFWIEKNRDWGSVRTHLGLLGVDTTGIGVLDSLKKVQGHVIAADVTTRSYVGADGETKTQNDARNFAKVE